MEFTFANHFGFGSFMVFDWLECSSGIFVYVSNDSVKCIPFRTNDKGSRIVVREKRPTCQTCQ